MANVVCDKNHILIELVLTFGAPTVDKTKLANKKNCQMREKRWKPNEDKKKILRKKKMIENIEGIMKGNGNM